MAGPDRETEETPPSVPAAAQPGRGTASVDAPTEAVPFRDAVRTWAAVAAASFGGPAGQIAVMHQQVVDRRGWVDDDRFLNALNYTMLLPGPEAHQLAVYLGWLLHGTRGGVVAGTLFVLPGFVSMLLFGVVYVLSRSVPAVPALFFGLKAAVVAVVLLAVVRLGRRTLSNAFLTAVAVAAFVLMYAYGVPFPLVVLGAGVVGWLRYRLRSSSRGSGASPGSPDPPVVHTGRSGTPGAVGSAPGSTAEGSDPDDATGRGELARAGDGSVAGPGSEPRHTPAAVAAERAGRPTSAETLRTAAVWTAVWLAPLVPLVAAFGVGSVFVTEAVFFVGVAAVSFGGAYAALAFVAQQAVGTFGWLSAGEMLDGIGVAEPLPGPLIKVVQFVAFLGAFRNPGGLDPLVAGLLGAAVAGWFTSLASYLWIFVGAPYVEVLRENEALSAALSAVTAAVVGVVANLGAWFAVQVLFAERTVGGGLGARVVLPVPASVDPAAAALAVGAWVAMRSLGQSIPRTLAAAALLGLVVG
jgi:chromate transporter